MLLRDRYFVVLFLLIVMLGSGFGLGMVGGAILAGLAVGDDIDHVVSRWDRPGVTPFEAVAELLGGISGCVLAWAMWKRGILKFMPANELGNDKDNERHLPSDRH